VLELQQTLISLSALAFDPDRFLDERVRKYLTPNPFIFLPFNAGMPFLVVDVIDSQ
jgi:hypothetical protein